MTTFARVVLVCFLASTCLLKQTSSIPVVPEYDNEEYNEIDFEDQIPFGKDVVDNPYRFDDDDEEEEEDESDDFDEERDIFKDALGPDNEDKVDGNEDDYESYVESKDYLQSGDGQLHQDDEDDNVDEMDSEETEETDEKDESGIKESISHEDHEIKVYAKDATVVEDGDDEDKNRGFVKKLKNFLRSITSFLLKLDRDKIEKV